MILNFSSTPTHGGQTWAQAQSGLFSTFLNLMDANNKKLVCRYLPFIGREVRVKVCAHVGIGSWF